MMTKLCIHCGGALIQATKEMELLEIEGHKFTATVPGLRCNKCGEFRVQGSILERLELLVAQKLADAGVHSGPAFKYMRKTLGLSGASLAELLDVAPETVSRWESGKRPVDRAAVAVLGSLVVDSLNQRTETIDRLRALREPPKLGKTVHLDVAAAAW